MSVQVIYKKETKSINRGVFAIFTDENFKPLKNKKMLSSNELEFLKRILKSKPKSKKKILYFDLTPYQVLETVLEISINQVQLLKLISIICSLFYHSYKNI